MKRLLAGAIALGVVSSSGGLGAGTALADSEPSIGPTPVGAASDASEIYTLGGARPPGIPWADYAMRSGQFYFPTPNRTLIDYPAGSSYNWVPEFIAGPGYKR